MIRKFKITVNGETYEVEVEEIGGSEARAVPTYTSKPTPPAAPPRPTPLPAAPAVPVPKPAVSSGGAHGVKAPLPGEILRVLVKEGDQVKVGDPLLVLEAMKMESEIDADKAGTIQKVLVDKGTIVESGQDLVIIE